MKKEQALQVFAARSNEETNWLPVSMDYTLRLAVSALITQDKANVRLVDYMDYDEECKVLRVDYKGDDVILFYQDSTTDKFINWLKEVNQYDVVKTLD